MPDGTIEVRAATSRSGQTATAETASAHPSGPGRPIFMMHGHIEKIDKPRYEGQTSARGMEDDVANGYGDTSALAVKEYDLPSATVYGDSIAWHEMVNGQLIFTAPLDSVDDHQASMIQSNLNTAQKRFLLKRNKKLKSTSL